MHFSGARARVPEMPSLLKCLFGRPSSGARKCTRRVHFRAPGNALSGRPESAFSGARRVHFRAPGMSLSEYSEYRYSIYIIKQI